jgi:uncharacterized membrane protein YfcA
MELSAPDFLPPLAVVFVLFWVVGFIAQLVDGALGMAYGVISSSVLIAVGVPPAQASATIHAAECFTTGASGASHMAHKNVDWKLFFRIAPAGIIGGVLGAYVVTGFDPTLVKALVIAYLGTLGLFMLWRAFEGPKEEPPHVEHAIPLGVVGGFLDASGGGGWGPVVTSTLLGRGHTPRYIIGTVNTSEFFVTLAISVAFIWTVLTGRWEIEGGFATGGAALAGLVLGGLVAAPLAGFVTKIVPGRLLLGGAALVVTGLALWQGWQLWPRLPELLDLPIVAHLTALNLR